MYDDTSISKHEINTENEKQMSIRSYTGWEEKMVFVEHEQE